ncbi:MAG: PAS domain-containing hybrid sensor histidine kinase/response regulator [Gammaproteobacteria bacterium]|jgi:PAS domain S-box-containing protein|nr:PAS domain-containing hybrid sensor histidine kinase/response regulator [Gammaproteobacteria bacterium]
MSLVSDKRISYAYAWALSAIALAFVLAQFLFLPAVETIDYIALIAEGIVCLFPWAGLIVVEHLHEAPSAYWPLKSALFFLLLSNLADALDEVLFQPDLVRILIEDGLSVLGFALLVYGLMRWVRYNQAILNKTHAALRAEALSRERLAASQRRYRTLFQSAASAGVVWGEGFIVTDWNQRAEAIFGWSRQEVLGRSFLDFMIPPAQRQAVTARLQFTGTEDPPLQSINQNLTKDGQLRWCEWFNTALPAMAGTPREFISLANDITERHELERALHRAKEQAEQATRAKSDFLANMSHEIRTPMSGIIGLTQLALQTELPPPQRDYLEKIDSSARSLQAILNDILDMSKIEAGKLTLSKGEFDLFELLDRAVGLAEPAARAKQLTLNIERAPGLGQFWHGDGLRIAQVLHNLLHNAIKFTATGAVGIQVSPSRPGRVRFEVRDTGVGLSAEQQLGIFDAFAQADASVARRFGGTGLGLAICKQLVALMDGEIWVESETGKGSRFSFDIALDERPRPVTQTPRAKPWVLLKESLRRLGGRRLLLVEDNAINRDIVLGLLEGTGLEVEVAEDGEVAVAKCRDRTYDLVLMDIRMPVMDGYEASRQIRHTAPDLPIIALTAHAFPEDADRARAAGMNAYLTKPIDFDQLCGLLLSTLSPATEQGDGGRELHSPTPG